MNPLSGWQNFYVIVGSSAGALIGLQFVVMTLISELPAIGNQEDAGAAFGTPTIVHFGAVLLLAAIQCAPWEEINNTSIAWALMGVCGIVYQCIVVRRMRTQDIYDPVFEDTLFHGILPFVAYIALATTVFVVRWDVKVSLFVVAGTALLLLFVGIHNAWDAVTYHVFSVRKKRAEQKNKKG
jgi:hypothetical protein